MSDDVKVGLGITVIVVLLFAGFLGLMYWASSARCGRVAAKMQMPHDYALLQGCMIQTKRGEWVPLQNYRDLAE